MSAVEELIEDALADSTTTASIPIAADAVPPVVLPLRQPVKARRKVKLSDLVKGRVKEATDDQSIIPADAQPALVSQSSQGAVTGSGNKESYAEPLIPTSVALVAPDTTPGAYDPLDPSQVPAPAMSSPAPAPASVDTPAEAPSVDGGDPLRVLLGLHQASFGRGVAINQTAPTESVDELVARGKAALQTSAATGIGSKMVAEAIAGKVQPPPTYDPNSMQRVTAVLRQFQ